MLAHEMRVHHRRAQIRVTHRFLHMYGVRALGEPRRHSAMPEIVAVKRVRQPRSPHGVLERASERVDASPGLVVTACRRMVPFPSATACSPGTARKGKTRTRRVRMMAHASLSQVVTRSNEPTVGIGSPRCCSLHKEGAVARLRPATTSLAHSSASTCRSQKCHTGGNGVPAGRSAAAQ
jgi:hypothetical protein